MMESLRRHEDGAEKPQFSAEKAATEERGVLEKFRGHAKKIAEVFMLATALTTGAGAVEQAFAGERTKTQEVETEAKAEERAMQLVEQLMSLPKNPRALNDAHERALRGASARQLVFLFAAQYKMNFPESGNIKTSLSPQDIRDALKKLEAATQSYADMHGGDEKMKELAKTNPGLRELIEMFEQFLQ